MIPTCTEQPETTEEKAANGLNCKALRQLGLPNKIKWSLNLGNPTHFADCPDVIQLTSDVKTPEEYRTIDELLELDMGPRVFEAMMRHTKKLPILEILWSATVSSDLDEEVEKCDLSNEILNQVRRQDRGRGDLHTVASFMFESRLQCQTELDLYDDLVLL